MKSSFYTSSLPLVLSLLISLPILYLIRQWVPNSTLNDITTLNCSNILNSKYIELFVSLLLLIITTVLVYSVLIGDKLLLIIYGLILAGGISNIVERLAYGCVTDYISFTKHLSVNIPDILISFGVLTIIIKLSIKPVLLSKDADYVNR